MAVDNIADTVSGRWLPPPPQKLIITDQCRTLCGRPFMGLRPYLARTATKRPGTRQNRHLDNQRSRIYHKIRPSNFEICDERLLVEQVLGKRRWCAIIQLKVRTCESTPPPPLMSERKEVWQVGICAAVSVLRAPYGLLDQRTQLEFRTDTRGSSGGIYPPPNPRARVYLPVSQPSLQWEWINRWRCSTVDEEGLARKKRHASSPGRTAVKSVNHAASRHHLLVESIWHMWGMGDYERIISAPRSPS